MEIDDTNGEDGDDGAVGYGRPPRHTRWKKGQSGNPSGRPKGARGLKTDLRAELVSRMEISMNGKRVAGTKQQLMLRTLSARAAAGDVRATRILIDLVLQVFGPDDEDRGPKRLSRTDQQILDELLGRRGAEGTVALTRTDTDQTASDATSNDANHTGNGSEPDAQETK